MRMIPALFAACCLSVSVAADQEKSGTLAPAAKLSVDSEDYGSRNPNAPKELAAFEFILGRWKCDVWLIEEDGTELNLTADWEGRYVLDGYAIEEDIRLFHKDGTPYQLNKVFRSVDPESKRWRIMWFEAMKSTWVRLTSDDLPPLKATDSSVSFQHRSPPNTEGISRLTFSDISKDSFFWSAKHSPDGGKTWNDIPFTFKARRVKGASAR